MTDGNGIPETMPCLVVGGVANGLFIQKIPVGVEELELSRPTGVKPLAASDQAAPEETREKDVYRVHVMICEHGEYSTLFGVATLLDETQSDAMHTIALSYVQSVATSMADDVENIIH